MVPPVEEPFEGSPGHGIAAIKLLLRDDAGDRPPWRAALTWSIELPTTIRNYFVRGEAGIISAGKGKVEIS